MRDDRQSQVEALVAPGEIAGVSLQSALDHASDGFAVLDAHWRVAYLNAAGVRLLAPLYPDQQDFLGRDHWELFPDLVGTELERLYRRVAADRVAGMLELYYPPLATWFEIRAYPNAGGGISIYFLDISARRRAELRLESEKNLMARVATGESLDQVLDALCRQVEAQSDDGMLCSVMLLEPDERHLRSAAGPSLSAGYLAAIDGIEIGPAVGSCGTAAYTGQMELAEDIETDPKWAPYVPLARAEGLRACCSRPIRSFRGNTLGTIAMYYRQPQRPSANDEGLVAFAADIAAIAIESRQTGAALQAAAERLRATFSQAAIGIAVCDLDGRFVEANSKFVELTGYTLDELQARGFADITHPDDLGDTRTMTGRLLSGEIESCVLEKRYIRKDGSPVWSQTTVTVLRDAGGEPRQFIAAAEDISLRKQAAAALEAREASLRVLADTMPHLVWMADGEGDIFWYNRRWYEYTGATESDMMRADGWHPMHDPEILPKVVERWKQSLATGEVFEMEFPLRDAQGNYRLFLTRALPVRDASGKIVRWFGTNTDMEAVDQARRALADESRVLDLINRTGQALVSELDLQDVLQKVTDAATELSGARFGAFFYNNTDEQGDRYLLYTLSGAPREAFEKFGHPRATALFGPTFRGDPTIRIDDVTTDPRYGSMGPHHGMPPGHLPVRSYLAVPVISRSGEVIGGLFFGHPDPGVFTERTERLIGGITAQAAVAIDNARLYEDVKRGAQERERLLAAEHAARLDAEQASMMKDEFLSTLSHELRTPLSAILGWTHLLQAGGCTPEDTDAGLKTIANSARAQAKLIDDLLDMSRIVSGKVRLDVQPTDLEAIVAASVDATRPSADAKQIRLRQVIDPKAGTVMGDPARLQQVIWNLLSNAIKFTPKGGSVDVALSRVDSQVELRVSDSGIGIDPAFLPHVFDRFRQADASLSRAHGGLGLGLAIVRQLVELHGGSVSAESEGTGHGSTFVVRLPVAARRAYVGDESGEAEDGDLEAAGGLRDNEWIDLQAATLLVVDDDPDTRTILGQLLERHGARVERAASAREALEALASLRPDAIVSDVGMPGMDGFAFMRQVRKLPVEQGGRAPAVALTAFASSQDRTRALMAGYQAHVAKPFEAQELLATIGSLLRRV
ncbi:GAF domain-containing protein [Luteimonas vadosa]|uniref:histidine kinase n=1 Tax=Luteimonas vadosa TaxID=1165507 RepID=A0ABP9DS59_9GAMM